jgi:teichuronic acid biosynthesis glycosyltransferase TuaC
VIAGDGSFRHRLEQRVLELGLQHRVLFAGLRPHHEMVRWMCACDVVVHPSLAEGSPLPVYEALACGRPVVASSVGGIPELIVGEQYGLLVPPADSASLAEALRCSLDREWDPELIRDRGLQFSWSAVADRLMSVYQEAVDG